MPFRLATRSRFALRGQALLLTLLLLVFVVGLTAVAVKVTQGHVAFSTTMRHRVQSRHLCQTGLDYALAALSNGDWLQQLQQQNRLVVERQFAGPVGRPGRPSDKFQVTVERTQWEQPQRGAGPAPAELPPPVLRVTATGTSGGQHCTRTLFASDPTDLFSFALNVYQLDATGRAYSPHAVTSLGGLGSGVESLLQELRIVPASGRVLLAGRRDPAFAAVAPNSVTILCRSATGLSLLLPAPEEGERVPRDRYRLEAVTGAVDFAPEQRGSTVVLRYDYYRYVPKSPGPFFFGVPYPPLVPRTEALWDSGGRVFLRDHVRPRLQGHYFVDDKRGQFVFTEHDTRIPVRTTYAFQGTRLTGPVRINGDLEWQGRNLFYLSGAARETVAASGRHRPAVGAHLFLTTEAPHTTALLTQPSGQFLEAAPRHWPPPLSTEFYRRLTDPALGGDGLYVDNPGQRQDPDQAWAEWSGQARSNWQGEVYDPPGFEVDLGKAPLPHNGVVFAEGNLRVRGQQPPGSRLTLVAAGTLYVESSVGPALPVAGNAAPGALALIAEHHVCINPTRFAEKTRGAAPIDASLHALVWARRGTFGTVSVPGGAGEFGRRNRLLVFGCVSQNTPYPQALWGQAFTSVEYLYDAALSVPANRPPWLVCELRSPERDLGRGIRMRNHRPPAHAIPSALALPLFQTPSAYQGGRQVCSATHSVPTPPLTYFRYTRRVPFWSSPPPRA